ncbi:MAG: hypothetical protein P8Z76_08540, partial [Alphaproteobacteria bacterium]
MLTGMSAFRPKADVTEVILPSGPWRANGQADRPACFQIRLLGLMGKPIGRCGQTHRQMGLSMSNGPEKKILSLSAVLMTVYVVGFLVTAGYYVIRGLI